MGDAASQPSPAAKSSRAAVAGGLRSLQGTHIGSIPCLYPAATRTSGLRIVMRGLARFIHTYGYWPKLRELTFHIRSYHGATVWYIRELEKLGYVARYSGHTRDSVYLTAAGWDALRIAPIEPWCKRPLSGARRAMLRKVALRLADVPEMNAAAVAQAFLAEQGDDRPLLESTHPDALEYRTDG